MEQQMTKRQKSAQETRRRLLVAARKILEKKDFADVTVADIAKEAGVAVGSFYVYFKRKEDIVEVLGRQYAAHGITKLGRFVNIIKPAAVTT